MKLGVWVAVDQWFTMVWTWPRSRSRRSPICEMYQVQKLSPLTFRVGSGKSLLILIVHTNVWIFLGPDCGILFKFPCHVTSKFRKKLFDTMFGKWNLCKGKWWREIDGIYGQMSDCTINDMNLTEIQCQCQGHGRFKVAKCTKFRSYLLRHLGWNLANTYWF